MRAATDTVEQPKFNVHRTEPHPEGWATRPMKNSSYTSFVQGKRVVVSASAAVLLMLLLFSGGCKKVNNSSGTSSDSAAASQSTSNLVKGLPMDSCWVLLRQYDDGGSKTLVRMWVLDSCGILLTQRMNKGYIIGVSYWDNIALDLLAGHVASLETSLSVFLTDIDHDGNPEIVASFSDMDNRSGFVYRVMRDSTRRVFLQTVTIPNLVTRDELDTLSVQIVNADSVVWPPGYKDGKAIVYSVYYDKPGDSLALLKRLN